MSEIYFNEQRNGYDKNQVDSYINKLTEAYQMAYNEYLAVCDRYNELMVEYKKLESEKQAGKETSVMSKTLIDSEKLANEIINDAYNEKSKIIEQTKKNLDYVYAKIGQSINEVQNFLNSRNSDRSGGVLNENETAT
jgi:cell division septum initiation protein DivIVA